MGKQAFVQAPVEEEIYVHQIKDFEKPGQETKILRLKKALYGTKQAANAWQKFLFDVHRSLQSMGACTKACFISQCCMDVFLNWL